MKTRVRPLKQWVKKICRTCNTPFETKFDKKVFCNNRCKCEWHNTRERIRIAKGKSNEVSHNPVSTSS